MGGKLKASRSQRAGRHDPLAQQIALEGARQSGPLKAVAEEHDELGSEDEDLVLGRTTRKKKAPKREGAKTKASTVEHSGKEFVDPRMTAKILQQAREQQEEMDDEAENERREERGEDAIEEDEEGEDAGEAEEAFPSLGFAAAVHAANPDPEEDAAASGADANYSYLDESKITDEDERILAMFRPTPAPAAADGGNRTLQDIIMEKIYEKERGALAGENVSAAMMQQVSSLDPKVVKVYKGVAKVLANHRSGQLPKAFKIIPTLRNWEEILFLTEPENWTAAAMFAATRLFSSNLPERLAQRFFALVLLPTVESNIEQFQRLNYHYYQALLKAAFKPAAFYRGLLLPLCSTGCSLRKATIFASVVAKTSIPMLHSSVALMKLAQMQYSGVSSLFIRVLLDKKYALPHKVLDALVEHFSETSEEERELPVLWHQSLLTFAQRYKGDLTVQDREKLKLALRKQEHGEITKETRRELFSAAQHAAAGVGDAETTDMEM